MLAPLGESSSRLLVPRDREATPPPFLGPMPPLAPLPPSFGAAAGRGLGLVGGDETTVGNHTIVELWGADAARLNDEALLRRGLLDAAEAGRLVVLEEVFHSFEGQGVTGMLLLSSSHLT